MLTFAIAVARRGRPYDSAELDVLRDRAAQEVPFPVDRHVMWMNEARTVWFGGWQAPGRNGSEAPRWHVDPDGLAACAGRAWPRQDGWSAMTPVATQLAQHLRRQPLVGNPDALAGVYVVASMARRGRCAVAADPLGIAPLHWGQTDDVVILSTRASIVAALLATSQGTTARRDVFGAGWLAYAGQVVGDGTGYERVSLVPEGAVVEIEPPGTARLRRCPRPPWRLHTDELAADPCAALDAVRGELMTAIRTALRDPGTKGCLGLTGGKDSRLILALLLADGSAAELEYQTFGGDDLPDVIVARQLTETFGLRHVTNPSIGDHWAWRTRVDQAARRGGLEHTHTREIGFRITAWATSGTRNVAQPHLGRLPTGGTVLLSGVCGETLRTHYHHSTTLRSKHEAARFPDHETLGAAAILHRDALARYRTEAHELLFDGATDEDSPQDVIDSFYLRHRLRRWLGPTQEVDSQNRVFPLYSMTAIRLAFAIGAENRHAEWIHHRLMSTACDPLVHTRFAADAWPRRAGGKLVPPRNYEDPPPPAPPRPRARSLVYQSLARLRPRALRPPAIRSVGRERRTRTRATDLEIMRRLFRHDAANPAFELVDAAAAQRALDRFDVLPESQRLQLYGALSTVIWLGGHELHLREVSTVRRPARSDNRRPLPSPP